MDQAPLITNKKMMYSPIKLSAKYFQYWLFAANAKGHGVHSPFVFELIERVLNDDRDFYYFPLIEAARESYLQDHTVLNITDFGAGSRLNASNTRSISSIAKSKLKSKKYSQLLFRMVNYFGSSTILELGTSLGISTSYLAAANSNASIITVEESTEIAAIAKKHFQYLGLKNIVQVTGNLDETLPVVLSQNPHLDFVLIDGNYRMEPKLRYFEWLKPQLHEYSVLVFDDIHRSKEMEMAWKLIQADEMVTLTIDLFFIGLVFFRKENKEKQHFSVRY